MRQFEYTVPKSTQQAVGLLGQNWSQAQILAGGTDILALMKDDVLQPKRLVNIKDIPGLSGIQFNATGWHRFGALTKLSEIADNADVRRSLPMLAWAVDEAASPQIRYMATLGGNLCQRPRCWYFRNGSGLIPEQQGKSLVVDGDNRYHAIIANDGPAKFVTPSTIAPALIAYEAKVRIVGPRGDREVELSKFYRIPKTTDEREHDLQPNDVVTEIIVPPGQNVKAAQYEVRQRNAFDWPLSLASVALWMNGNTIQKANVVLGAVAPVPWISQEAAQALVGKQLNEQTADAAAQAAVSIAKPLSRNAYKVQLTRVAVKRALLQAAKGGQQ
ncbi:MAG TPA: xanthine dehydrogenase family protein subunit M [Terriglobales bacterium]|nr:xanthine dehydrogenase family protein subunit M [Terriglobales bacterium]